MWQKVKQPRANVSLITSAAMVEPPSPGTQFSRLTKIIMKIITKNPSKNYDKKFKEPIE